MLSFFRRDISPFQYVQMLKGFFAHENILIAQICCCKTVLALFVRDLTFNERIDDLKHPVICNRSDNVIILSRLLNDLSDHGVN